jgi:hypothetical protein
MDHPEKYEMSKPNTIVTITSTIAIPAIRYL